MVVAVVAANLILTVLIAALFLMLRWQIRAVAAGAMEPLSARIDSTRQTLEEKFGTATADMAGRLERTNGDLRQDLADRLTDAFRLMRDSVETQLTAGRKEQSTALVQAIERLEQKLANLQCATEQRLESFADKQSQSLGQARVELSESLERSSLTLKQELAAMAGQTGAALEAIRAKVEQKLEVSANKQRESLAEVRQELATSLERSGAALRQELANLIGQTRASLEAIRGEVDQKLLVISDQVQHKLDQNIKEGFRQFEKVQEHLRAAEEQLRNVSTLGNSINDLNNLLKLPHLRGRFGEESLERLLADFLPASMYELQAAAGENGQGRADAIIKFPERVMPIDAKFPREQVLALFEISDPGQVALAREEFARVMKEQARRIGGYIHPENGTTDMALMYLPSETLYMEAVLNSELSEWLNKHHVFPVSPNTLIVTLQSIQMVFKMYEFAKGYERATEELKKAQTAFGYFENRFDEIGRSLEKAQAAYEVARGHLSRYRNRVTNLTGEMPPELPALDSGNNHIAESSPK